MPQIVSDMNVLVKAGAAVYDEEKGHYVNEEGDHLVSFQDVASGHYKGHYEESLYDYDEPGFSVPVPDLDEDRAASLASEADEERRALAADGELAASVHQGEPTKGKAIDEPVATSEEKPPEAKTAAPAPEASSEHRQDAEMQQAKHKRSLDKLRHEITRGRDVYKSPHLKRTLIEADVRQITVHGISRLAADAAIDIVEERGWLSITVAGSEKTRQALWMAAQERGVDVKGYEPTPTELAWLDKKTPKAATVEEVRQRDTAEERPGSVPETAPAEKETPNNPENLFSGVVASFGRAKYKHEKNGNPSYYVSLRQPNNTVTTVWGKDLERVVSEKAISVGDTAGIAVAGRVAVTVPVRDYDDNGNLVGTTTKEAHLNQWVVHDLTRSTSKAPEKEHEREMEVEP